MHHLDLFSGIGGFALAVDTVWPGSTHTFVDNDPFCQAILKKHWPNSELHGDINDFLKDLECGNVITWKQSQQKTGSGIGSIGETTIIATRGKGSRITKHTQGIKGKSIERLFSKHTEESANVAEKKNRGFSTSTTRTMMGLGKENATESLEPIETLSKETSPQATNSSAGTATCQKDCTENVPTNYERPFILTAGVPCQPASQAGRRKGKDDNRWLWPQTFRAIRYTQPTWVILENVRGLLTLESGVVFQELLTSLENEGYQYETFVIPAVAVNAPHRRDRIWFIAFNTKHDGRDGSQDGQGGAAGSHSDATRTDEVQQPPRPDRQGDDAANATDNDRRSGRQLEEAATIGTPRDDEPARSSWNENWIEVAARLCTLDDGLPNGLARPRGWRNAALKGAGNAIVPQVAIEIMQAISHVTERE